jgi:hypothetical protein
MGLVDQLRRPELVHMESWVMNVGKLKRQRQYLLENAFLLAGL